MRFFFRRKENTKDEKSREWIRLSGRPYNDYIHSDASLKIWLPEAIESKLDEVGAYIDTTKSDFIRQILFVHLYGRTDFLALIQMQHPSLVPSAAAAGISFSTVTSVSSPPKNDVGMKIWLPAQMKADLDRLAIKHGMSMSSYAREVITTHLVGHVPYDDNPYRITPPNDFCEE